MASSGRLEERVPLLTDEEQEPTEDDLSDLQVAFKQRHSAYASQALGDGAVPLGRESSSHAPRRESRRRRKQFSGNEMIVAVFVVQFDIRRGNVVEWKYPDVVNLEGIEFKCIASGSHNIPKDFVYFKQGQLFGLSCFEKIQVKSESERGVRMKSVGLLAVGYSDLHLHQDFLQRQVRIQVETPGSYGSLEEYFRHYQSPRQSSSVPRPLSNGQHGMGMDGLPPMEITHPAGCFSQFLQFYGPHIFTLWKLALLRKRIILYSPPPIGVVCYRVYCTCLLTCHVLQDDIDTDCNPMFYVNVNDIDVLQSTSDYVACTSEMILQSKTSIYDVFVEGQKVTSHLASLDPLLRLSAADKERYELLNNIRSNQLITSGGAGDIQNDDYGFAAFFQELNSQLFRTMNDAASSEDHLLTLEMVESVGLDPVMDRLFLTELAGVLNFDLNVQRPSDMMDLFSCCC